MEINNVKFSVSKKMLLLVASFVIPFGLIIVYTISGLVRVGDEIHQMQQVDIPAINALADLEGMEFRRHALVEKVHFNRSSDSSHGDDLVKYETEYGELTGKIAQLVGSSSGRESGQESLTSLFNRLPRGAEALLAELGQFITLQEEVSELIHPFFDLAVSSETLELQWKVMEAKYEVMDDITEGLLHQLTELGKEDAMHLSDDEYELIKKVVISSALVLLLCCYIAWRIIRSIVDPLLQLTEHARRIANGDLTWDVVAVDSSDEFAVLAHSFAQMQDGLRDQMAELKRSIETIGVSIQQTSASVREQASSSKEEAASIQEITTTMQEIQQSGSEIGERATEVGNACAENLSASEAGLLAVEATSSSMSLIREQVEEVAEKIVNLSDKTQAIGDIVSTVNDIAEQSNILAINASIEAASAGESGSRFSIVAQEMKNLADQAKDCTRQVRGILGDIQKGINTSVMLTEEAVKRSEVGKHQSEEANTSIHELLESSRDSLVAFQQITEGTKQQQIGVDQVAQGMCDIRQAVQQTVGGISELEQATASLNQMSSKLSNIIDQYKT